MLSFINEDVIDNFACSLSCPCPETNAAAWTALKGDVVQKAGRSNKFVFGGKVYNFGESTGRAPTASEKLYGKTFDTFADCLREVPTRPGYRTDSSNNLDTFASIFDTNVNGGQDLFGVVEWLESTYECSGFCVPDMFFYTLPLSLGVPTTSCIGPLSQDFGGVFGRIGMAGVLCGIVLFFVFIFSYCLWKKYDD